MQRRYADGYQTDGGIIHEMQRRDRTRETMNRSACEYKIIIECTYGLHIKAHQCLRHLPFSCQLDFVAFKEYFPRSSRV